MREVRHRLAKPRLTGEAFEIYKMLDFLLRNHPLGLIPFMDERCPLPTSQDFADMISSITPRDDLGVRITGGESVPEAQRMVECAEPFMGIVERYGGQMIRDVFKDWVARYPHKAQVIRQWSLKGGRTMAEVVDSTGYQEVSSVYKVCQSYLASIAYDIDTRQYVIKAQDAQ